MKMSKADFALRHASIIDRIVYRVVYTADTGEGIVVSLDRDGNDIRGARHEDPARRIVTTKPGERIWALGEWLTVATVEVHTAIPLPVGHQG